MISCFSTFAYALLSAWSAALDSSLADWRLAGWHSGESLGFGVRETWVRILASQLISYVTLDKYLNKCLTSLSLSFLIWKNGNNDT